MTKFVNVYIVYDLDVWPRYPSNNLKFKKCVFVATIIVKNSDKEKYVYSGYGITFDSAGSWSFDNEIARNVVMFGVNNSSSSHADNCKNKFLALGEVLTIELMEDLVLQRKSLLLILVKQIQKFTKA